MAAEVFRIEIPINVQGQDRPGSIPGDKENITI